MLSSRCRRSAHVGSPQRSPSRGASMLPGNAVEIPQETPEVPRRCPSPPHPRHSQVSGRHPAGKGPARGQAPGGHGPPAPSPTRSPPGRPRAPAPACSLLLPREMGSGRLCSPGEARGAAGPTRAGSLRPLLTAPRALTPQTCPSRCKVEKILRTLERPAQAASVPNGIAEPPGHGRFGAAPQTLH